MYHQEDAVEKPLLERFKADCKNWPSAFVKSGRETFLATENMIALLLAGGMSVAMHQNVDTEIAEHLEEHRKLRNLRDEGLNFIGHPTTHFVATGLWYALSAEKQDEFNNRRAWTMMTALSVTWVTTAGLKVIRNNETPNGDDLAWPSGHTASSFTVASVLDEFYGPKVGFPAYAAASLVAYRMMDTGNHWASDVVFGATLGWVVGHTVAGKHKSLELGGFRVVPQVVTSCGPGIGISLLKQF
ncbi:phosphatase PAP2 family protein [Planctomycetota bacterium]